MARSTRVLIVDDDAGSLGALADWVSSRGHPVSTAATLAEARAVLEKESLALAVLDLELPDGSGVDLIEPLVAADVDVVIVTAYGSIDGAMEAVRGGVLDYLEKPVNLERLGKILGEARRTSRLRRQVRSLRGELRRLGRFGQLVGASAAMQRVYDLIAKVAPTGSTVLLLGETGTGKEVVAQSIHALSRRAERPFVPINCGAVASQLIENELFGHEKGSFTGADRQHKGVFEQADGGTLFLDEITEMSPDLQVKLLRVLETGQVTRIGGDAVIDVDVRLITASNRDPEKAVAEGKLREDLKYRLDVFPIELPPLRDREDDIGMLAEHFLAELNEQAEGEPKRLSAAAVARLATHDWPGNVRELRNAIERAYILAGEARAIDASAVPVGGGGDAPGATDGPPDGDPEVRISVGSTIAKAEKELILATLEHTGGDKKAACRLLGISIKTLYARLKLYEGGPE